MTPVSVRLFFQQLTCSVTFLPCDASAERGYQIAFVCLSVRL